MNHFVWNADRVILEIYGPIALRWYSLLFLAGFLIGLAGFNSMLRKEGKNPEKYADTLLFYLIMGTIIGARLGHCLFYRWDYFLHNPLKIFLVWEGGLASHGGYIGIIIAMILFVRKFKELSFFYVADRVGVWAVMVGGFIRLGNFFNSEIIGRVSDVPWAIIFKKVDDLPRHPSQLYESASFFLSALIGYSYYRYTKGKPLPGSLLGLCMILGFGFRGGIESFKENQMAFEDSWALNMGQMLSIPFILVGCFLFFGFHKKWVKEKRKT
jgi:phosphatidylglycerol:prolipoprotein diacylglycerol transferase